LASLSAGARRASSRPDSRPAANASCAANATFVARVVSFHKLLRELFVHNNVVKIAKSILQSFQARYEFLWRSTDFLRGKALAKKSAAYRSFLP
jgi:hypothetical protein